jgi:hypothetical protein
MARKSVPQLSEEEMIQVIEDFKKSGLTRRAFSKERGYPMSNFYYWQNKYYQKFPEQLETEKPRRGRKPKALLENAAGAEGEKMPKIAAKKSKKKVSGKKGQAGKKAKKPVTAKKIAVVVEDGINTTAKKRGRPKKVELPINEPMADVQTDMATPVLAAETKAKASKVVKGVKSIKAPKTVAKSKSEPAENVLKKLPVNTPVIQIRYPNGIRINVTADIDIKRLKELMTL